MTGDRPYDLAADLRRTGIGPADLARLTGANRSTVSRWLRGLTPVPPYVRTILRQQRRIRTLAEALAEALAKVQSDQSATE